MVKFKSYKKKLFYLKSLRNKIRAIHKKYVPSHKYKSNIKKLRSNSDLMYPISFTLNNNILNIKITNDLKLYNKFLNDTLDINISNKSIVKTSIKNIKIDFNTIKRVEAYKERFPNKEHIFYVFRYNNNIKTLKLKIFKNEKTNKNKLVSVSLKKKIIELSSNKFPRNKTTKGSTENFFYDFGYIRETKKTPFGWHRGKYNATNSQQLKNTGMTKNDKANIIKISPLFLVNYSKSSIKKKENTNYRKNNNTLLSKLH